MIVSAKVVGDNVDYETYSRQAHGVARGHPDFSMSRGEEAAFAECPEKWLAGCPSKDTKATVWGRLTECLEMSPDRFDSLFAVTPANYPCEPTKRDQRTEKPWHSSTYCDAWEAERKASGLTVVSTKLRAEAELAVKAAQAYAPRAELVACSKKQVMCVGEFRDKATGVIIPLRCLIDLVPDESHPVFSKTLADSKTARNGNPNTFDRVIDDSGYDWQAAQSIDLFVKATGRGITDWVFPLSENTPPYHVVKPMPMLTAEFIAYGRAKYESALAQYAKCLSTGHWPSYSTGNRVVLNKPHVQLIGPEGLYAYRESGGAVASRMEYEPEPRPEPEEPTDVAH